MKTKPDTFCLFAYLLKYVEDISDATILFADRVMLILLSTAVRTDRSIPRVKLHSALISLFDNSIEHISVS